MNDTKILSARVPKGLKETVVKASQEEKISVSEFLNRLIKGFFDEKKRR